jgi:L-ascorbate metabolism protein UlaG (beta-lactamase superfamily)
MGLPTGTTITWYGHSCFEIRTADGRTVLIDPWFANPSSPKAAEAVDRCDLLLVTHGHFDHLGDAVAIASRLRPAWPCMHEMSLWLARRLPGGAEQVIGMNKGGTVDVAGLRVTMTTADHSAGDWNPGGETTLYLGDPVGFVIELEDGFRLYFAGDTRAFSDMRLIHDLYRPELAFLPIGDHYTMGPVEAALAVEFLAVDDVVPMHYGTFPVLTGTPDQLRAALDARGLGHVRVHAPVPGGPIDPV